MLLRSVTALTFATASMSLTAQNSFLADMPCVLTTAMGRLCAKRRVYILRKDKQQTYVIQHSVIQSSDRGDTSGLIVNDTKLFERILYYRVSI
jgi:hypothetical protein